MTDLQQYLDLVTTGRDSLDTFWATQRLCQLAGLREGALIPFPGKMLRIAGAPLDFYQLLKMTANANLAHKVHYKQTATDPGANLTEVVMVFYDDQSFAETKALFDHYGIVYTEQSELDLTVGGKKKPFQSAYNPPDEHDQMFSRDE